MQKLLLFIIVFSFISCKSNELEKKTSNESELSNNALYYLFLGHIYDKKNIIDKRIKKSKKELDFFNQIWLGGDIALDAGLHKNLVFLDSIFNITSNQCHWAFGNHDLTSTNTDSIYNYTKHPPYYATYTNGITLLIYNTNYNTSGPYKNIVAQTDFIKSVCDTIKQSSHLVLISHQAAWENENKKLVKNTANAFNERYLFYFNPKLTFQDIIYPKLIDVQNRNVQVILLAGDYGQKQSTFEYMTNDSIYFLGNGIISEDNYNSKFKKWQNNDSVLIFKHIPNQKKLTWSFVNIGD